MDQAAADKVAVAVGFKIKDNTVTFCEPSTADHWLSLWNHAVSLQSQLSASEERVRWIPVSERLPEEDQTVLTAVPFYTNGKLVEVAVEHCRYYEGGRTCGQKIFVTCEGEEYEHAEVTAWMPLPSPPQVESKG